MAFAPTLHYLIFKNNGNRYDVYEQHTCQEKGCFKTDEAFLTTCSHNQVEEFVKEYNDSLLNGKVDSYEIVDHEEVE